MDPTTTRKPNRGKMEDSSGSPSAPPAENEGTRTVSAMPTETFPLLATEPATEITNPRFSNSQKDVKSQTVRQPPVTAMQNQFAASPVTQPGAATYDRVSRTPSAHSRSMRTSTAASVPTSRIAEAVESPRRGNDMRPASGTAEQHPASAEETATDSRPTAAEIAHAMIGRPKGPHPSLAEIAVWVAKDIPYYGSELIGPDGKLLDPALGMWGAPVFGVPFFPTLDASTDMDDPSTVEWIRAANIGRRRAIIDDELKRIEARDRARLHGSGNSNAGPAGTDTKEEEETRSASSAVSAEPGRAVRMGTESDDEQEDSAGIPGRPTGSH